MGARRNFRRSEQAQKRPPGMEKKIAKRPPHGEKRPPDRGIVAKGTPYSPKKISRGGGDHLLLPSLLAFMCDIC